MRAQSFTTFSLGISEIRTAAWEDAWLLGNFDLACLASSMLSPTCAGAKLKPGGQARALASLDISAFQPTSSFKMAWLCCKIAIIIPRGEGDEREGSDVSQVTSCPVKLVLLNGSLLHACLLQGERVTHNPTALQQA